MENLNVVGKPIPTDKELQRMTLCMYRTLAPVDQSEFRKSKKEKAAVKKAKLAAKHKERQRKAGVIVGNAAVDAIVDVIAKAGDNSYGDKGCLRFTIPQYGIKHTAVDLCSLKVEEYVQHVGTKKIIHTRNV